VQYWRVPRLIEELRIAHSDGSYVNFLKTLSKPEVMPRKKPYDKWDGRDRCAREVSHGCD
jgi:hypothetical protein